MPLLAVKASCYFKNSEFLQKIIENYSTFDPTNMMEGVPAEMLEKFEIKETFSYRVLEGQ